MLKGEGEGEGEGEGKWLGEEEAKKEKILKPGECEGLFEEIFLSFLYLLYSAPHLHSATSFYLQKFCDSYNYVESNTTTTTTNITTTNSPPTLVLLMGCLGVGKKG